MSKPKLRRPQPGRQLPPDHLTVRPILPKEQALPWPMDFGLDCFCLKLYISY